MSIYKFDDKIQISAHFNVQEFRCKCGQNHDILISDNLIQMLEKLYSKLNCSKIIVTSGHRCAEYDKKIGNSGTGQHIIGNAADVCCYGQDGKPISSKLVSCTAQDLGFTGIANITKAYIYTHLDVRTSGKYYGDETVNYHTLTDDFYKYYGVQKKEDDFMTVYGIDVSKYQGDIDWNKVKASGKVEFAILRAGIGNSKDVKFEEYYQGAKKNNIHVGAYWYSKAVTAAQAVQEANAFLNAVKGKQFAYPLYFDIEEAKQFTLGKTKCSEIAKAFLGTLEKAGYYAGIYASKSHLEDYLTEEVRNRYAVWVAHYNVSQTTYSGHYEIWQYSDSGTVFGIPDNQVDFDVCYADYPAIIKNAGLNGYPLPDTNTTITGERVETVENSVETNQDEKPIEISVAEPSYYKVRKGDTLTKIAKAYNTTVNKIVSDNKIAYPLMTRDYICVGWVLKV